MCSGHRFGSGHWFRCYECPAEALRQARETWEAQVLEEKKAERARDEAEAARLAELGPPHLSPPGTFRAGVWWGLGRMALLREVAEASLGKERRPSALPAAGPRPEGLAPGRRGPRRGRAVPWRGLRRWRRQIARRRGDGGAVLPRPRDRVRRPSPPWAYRAYRAAVILVAGLALAVVPLRLVRRDIDDASVLPVDELQAGGVGTGDAGVPDVWPADLAAGSDPGNLGQAPRPLKGQKRAPCDVKFEVEVSGVCWLPVEAKPPRCPPQTIAHAGKCLLPLGQAQAPPVSYDAGQPG